MNQAVKIAQSRRMYLSVSTLVLNHCTHSYAHIAICCARRRKNIYYMLESANFPYSYSLRGK